jgi:Na+/H+ antiporter NhaB
MAPVTLPVMICGLLTCLLLEKTKRFGYAVAASRTVLQEFDDQPPAAQPSGSPAADCSGLSASGW